MSFHNLARLAYRKIRPLLKRIDHYFMKLEAEKEAAQTFEYTAPETIQSKKHIAKLCRNPRMRGSVQTIPKGISEQLHHHDTVDGFWFVLSGRVRFLTTQDRVIGEFGPHQGIMTPQGFPYRFETVGTKPLQMLQVLTINPEEGWHRQNHGKSNFDRAEIDRSDSRTNPRTG